MAKSSVRMEEIVRPFAAAPLAPASRIAEGSPDELPPAFITWGGPGPLQLPPGVGGSWGEPIGDWEFPLDPWELLPEPFRSWSSLELEEWLEFRNLTLDDISLGPGQQGPSAVRNFNLELFDPADADEEDATLAETSRSVSIVRVENPDDPEQYVDVERIESVSFARPGGGQLTLQFRNR